MRTKSERWLLGLGLAYVLATPLLISVAVGWRDMPAFAKAIGGQTAAAWVQALGSGGAITAAFMIARRDHIEAQRRDRRKQKSLLNVAVTVSNHSVSAVTAFYKVIADSAQVDLLRLRPIEPTSDLADIADSIDNLPLHEIEDADVVFKLRMLKVHVRYGAASQKAIIENIRAGEVVEHSRVIEWRQRRRQILSIERDLLAYRDQMPL